MNKLEAVIFDMNGTVLKDEGLYTESFKKVLKKINKPTKIELTKGISLYNNWKIIVNDLNIDDHKIEDLTEMTQDEYRKLIKSVSIREGFFELSKELKKVGIKKALATSNERSITGFVFRNFDLKKHFDVVVTANDVNEVKPNPEIFLLASKLLSVKPENVVVFEDAQAGIEAAKKGKFKVIGIDGNSLKETDKTIHDFTQINADSLQQLVNS